MSNRFVFVLLLLHSLVFPLSVCAQQTGGPPMAGPPGPPGQTLAAPPLARIAPGVFEIGGVRILKKEDRVIFPATVNMEKGLLEYLIVGDVGKVHESLLRTKVEPYSLQIALLLLGLEGSTNPLSAQGEARTPEGDPVTIWVEVKTGGMPKKMRIEQWVQIQSKGESLEPMEWIFTGSVILDGVFMAQAEKSIVAVFHDPVAMIDNSLPEGASDEVWFVNEKAVPPVGTEVSVIIQREPKKQK